MNSTLAPTDYNNHSNHGKFSSSQSDPSANGVSVTFAKDEKRHLTPYAKLLYDSQHDARFKDEEKAGRRIGFYRIRTGLGSGNFSLVKLGLHLLAKEKVAIKILDKTKLDEATQRLLSSEITSMERLHHPNIIRLYEVIETPTNIFIINEYASGGDLYTRILDNGKFSEDDAKMIFAQITAAVEHMHSKGIVHRDIKSENLFFANEHLIKLGDFGLSTHSEKDQLLTTFCGSPPYAAPELYRDTNYIGIYVDIWAMGILLYFMVTSLMPFRAENTDKLRESIIDGNYSIPTYLSNECQKLIRGLLQHEIRERWSIEQIRTCAWLRDEHFPKELEPLPINLTSCWTSINKSLNKNEATTKTPESLPPTSSFEYAARSRLEELGITSELLQAANKNSDEKFLSNRDSINGTYRIILHRLQKQSSQLERDDLYDTAVNDEFSATRDRSMSISDDSSRRKDLISRRASVSNGKTKHSSVNSPAQTAKMCIIL